MAKYYTKINSGSRSRAEMEKMCAQLRGISKEIF